MQSEMHFTTMLSFDKTVELEKLNCTKIERIFEKYSNLEIKIEINNQSNSEEDYLNCTHFDILIEIFEIEKSNLAHLFSTLGQKSTFTFLAKFTHSKSHI